MMVGQTISHYRISEKLGEGGMGVVYRAEDLTLGRPVALKFISMAFGSEPTSKHRFVQEARASATLNHPNIATVYEFAESDEHSFIAMEYIEGQTLHELIDERSFSVEEVVTIGEQIGSALVHAHARGVIHRDLKSSNVMLDAEGRAKVMDFGLAKIQESSFITQAGTAMGTAAFMAPEQFEGGEPSPQTDLFAIGVILYHLATGRLPFDHPHYAAVMYSVLHEDPTPPAAVAATIPGALNEVILKALEKEPSRRYESAQSMADALKAVGRGAGLTGDAVFGVSDVKGGVLSGATDFLSRLPSARHARAAFYIAPILGALVLGLLFLTGDADDPTGPAAARAYVERATDRLSRGDTDGARTYLQQALASDSTYAPAWGTWSALYVAAGDYDRAVAFAERAVELDPGYRTGLYNLAFALDERGELQRAESYYRMAIQVDSTFVEAYSALGHLLIRQSRTDEALDVLDRAVRAAPDAERIFLVFKNLGLAQLVRQNFDDALEHLARARALRPEYPETWALLARTYDGLGRTEAADQAWTQYTTLIPDSSARTYRRETLPGE